MIRRRVIGGAALGLATTSFVASLGAAACLAFPLTGFANASGLAGVHEARATALLVASHGSERSRAEARRQTWKALGTDPANPASWMRLAYLDSLQSSGLSQEGRRFLARSYSLAPYGPDNSRWRLEFAFNHWQGLDPALRRKVVAELRVAGRHGGYRSLPDAIDDPSGRLAAALTLASLSRQGTVRRTAPEHRPERRSP